MKAIIFDAKTTGSVDPEIVELTTMETSFVYDRVDPRFQKIEFGPVRTQRYKPSKQISMEAMARHHIMDIDLQGEMSSLSFRLPEDVQYMIGHDYEFMPLLVEGRSDVRCIDTQSIAKKFWPDCDAHSLGALTYFFLPSTARSELINGHSSIVSVKLTGR